MDHKALQKLSYGLYVVSSLKKGRANGQIANTVFQAASQPPTVAVSINKDNYTHECILDSGVFSVSVLSQETPMTFIGTFGFKSGRETDKFAGVGYKKSENGVPVVLDNSLSYMTAKVKQSADAGTHTIFIGEVIEAEVIREGTPMTYEYYHGVKKGFSPKNAPTYAPEAAAAERKGPEEGEKKMQKYRCTVCGYLYEPEKGDPDGKIKPGTAFENLPAGWVCPVCGAAKSQFEAEK
jgi:flavin reductase (DIM6/NTAB) family NADH-FMN oxidoreductase RutF/rubredoxin